MRYPFAVLFALTALLLPAACAKQTIQTVEDIAIDIVDIAANLTPTSAVDPAGCVTPACDATAQGQ